MTPNKKMKTKDVYYKDVVYEVPIKSLKHLNGYDVVKLNDDLYVYWSDSENQWIEADALLIYKYSNKTKITLNYKGMTFEGNINENETKEINGKKINKIKVEHLIEYDNVSDTWDILDIDSMKYDKFK